MLAEITYQRPEWFELIRFVTSNVANSINLVQQLATKIKRTLKTYVAIKQLPTGRFP